MLTKEKSCRCETRECNYGEVLGVSGPVVVASNMRGSAMYEVVKVGYEKLLGEVIRLDNDTATVQVNKIIKLHLR